MEKRGNREAVDEYFKLYGNFKEQESTRGKGAQVSRGHESFGVVITKLWVNNRKGVGMSLRSA